MTLPLLHSLTLLAQTVPATNESPSSHLMFWIWVAIAAVSIVASAIFSGSEVGLYSLSKVRLRLRTAKGDPHALLVQEWLRRPTYPIEALLILQNVAGFGFSAAITGILSEYGFSEMGQAVLSVVLITPMILLFAEIMPKDLFNVHADRWTYAFVPLLKWCFKAITIIPLLPIVNALSWLSVKVARLDKHSEAVAANTPAGGRLEMMALFQESAATGLLTGTQQDLVQRALRLARISVREVMIPWPRVIGVPSSISREGFLALVRRFNFSRMPVLGRSTTEVLGIVDVLDALSPDTAPGITRKPFTLGEHSHPVMTLIGEQSVRSAITLMQRARQTVAIVVDRQGRASGLVTMKDLVEELVGDLENW